MISDKMAKALNDQITAEMYSSYLYLAMAAHLESENYNGFAGWMRAQSSEEWGHGMKLYKYLGEVGKKVDLAGIEKPKTSWNSPQEIFEEALKHELYITERINNLVNLALEEKDHATNIFLHYFVTEQVEEVSTATSIVEKFKMVGDNKVSLYLLDKELGQRAAH
ncbi:ferritin [bacterium BRH_c32]|nr:MAG: ferritin [bacterium BRH_c32]